MQHRKMIKHVHEKGDFHELTFSCYQRRPLLTNESWLHELSKSIDQAGCEEQFQLMAFVYMPEHVHLLVFPLEDEPAFGRYLAKIKLPFSRHAKTSLTEANSPLVEQLTVQERPGKTCFRFWQEGPGYDRNIKTKRALLSAIDYIHHNPVRRGLQQRAVDWPWSSARYYLSQPEKQQLEFLPKIWPFPAGCFD